MSNATVRANARTLPRRPPVSRSLRRRLEASLENLVSLLDEMDGDPDLEDGHDREHDEAELSGIADDDGRIEQLVGEPSLGATLDVDQRIAWGADRLSYVTDGEASVSHDDIASFKSTEAWRADRAAAHRANSELASIVQRRRAAP